jgi:hypothetical protein
VHLTQADNGMTVRVRVGTIIVVNLAGQPCDPRTQIVQNIEGRILDRTASSLTAASGATATFVATDPGIIGIGSSDACTEGTCAITFQVGLIVSP